MSCYAIAYAMLLALISMPLHGMLQLEDQVEHEQLAFPAEPPSTWLTFHLAHPGTTAPGDPNAAFFWKGRYHLHYIYEGKDGVSWAHVSSPDMVHWKWHPTTLTPATMGHGMFSGTGFFTKEGRPAIIYHGEGTGRNQIAFAEDDLLERWSKPIPVNPKTEGGELPAMRHWDPDCWLDGDTYYAISGGQDPHLMKSTDLRDWKYSGRLLHERIPVLDVPRDEDISCPNMFKLEDKWMLLCLSHWIGSRYYLGDFKEGKFLPESHHRMNWMCAFQGGDEDADLYAPESVLTPDGRRVMWAWSRVKHRLSKVPIQSSIQCLPRELSLAEDGVLRIKPLRELEQLRYDERTIEPLHLDTNTSYPLPHFTGDALELKLVFVPAVVGDFGVRVYCDQQGENGFEISFDPEANMLTVGPTQIPFTLQASEELELRVFLDKSIIEVFVNDRLAALAPHQYAAENLGVSVFSAAGTVQVKEAKSWKLRSIYGD